MTIFIGKVGIHVGHYVGRPTALGNQYIIGTHGDRDAVCDQYDEWFHAELYTGGSKAFNIQLASLFTAHQRDNGIILLCHCHPQRCHATTIAEHMTSVLQGVIASSAL